MAELIPYTVPSSREVSIGPLKLGRFREVVVQSMANSDTSDIETSKDQFLRLKEAGSEMVRFTVQGRRELDSLKSLTVALRDEVAAVPVVADIHFNPALAEKAAVFCTKVRINPGNFTEKLSGPGAYTDKSYASGLQKNREKLATLLGICREHHTALRIGVNHGSLSRRIMSRYGDTPEGMVESALEFLRICREELFENVVVSLKSSNSRLMVHAVRLLVHKMIVEDLYFPVHLGVTEAGNELEGRLKSVTGIAPLLLEGIGDTIRVSLTEDPVREIPVARNIADLFPRPEQLPYHPFEGLPWDPFSFHPPLTGSVGNIGGAHVPVVLSDKTAAHTDPAPDVVISPGNEGTFFSWKALDGPEEFPEDLHGKVILLNSTGTNIIAVKAWLIKYYHLRLLHPVILEREYRTTDPDRFSLECAGELGSLLVDRLIDGIWIKHTAIPPEQCTKLAFQILQASGVRLTRTEFIACPSCGRTQFDIESVLNEVKAATGHLKGLKIAVMGCIVNGPGEMADADYGYVGSGKNRVTLYKGRTIRKKGVEQVNAISALVNLIREEGDWIDP